MIARTKPRPTTIDAALGEARDKPRAESAGKIGWRTRRTTIAPGRKARLSVCGRFRIVEARLIDGVPIRRDRRGNPVARYHAMRRTESPPGNYRWDLLSTHRTESAAQHACRRAARPDRRKPTSRRAKPTA